MTEANTGDIAVKLKRKRDRRVDEVIAEVREKISKQVPMLDVEFVQLLQDMIGDLTSAPEPIAIKLFSQDPALLQQWAPQVGDAIKKMPGVVDVLERDREHDQRSGNDVPGGSGGGGARRLHAAGDRARRERDPAGRTGGDAGRA